MSRRPIPPARARRPRSRIHVADVDPLAALPRDPGRQRDADARRLDAAGTVERPEPLQVRGVRKDAARIVLEAIPLRDEVVAAVVPISSIRRPWTWLTSATCGA